MRSMFFISLAACGVERMPNTGSEPDATTVPDRGDSSDTPAFGAPGGGALEPVEPTETTEPALDDTGTAAETESTEPDPTMTVEDTGDILFDDYCPAGESQITLTYDPPNGATEVVLSGMLEATYGGFGYVINMQSGSPVGMTVDSVDGTIIANYDVCTPDNSRWELSASYVLGGTTHWSCEGPDFIEHGTFTVTVDEAAGPEPAPVSNGIGGCEHEFWQ